MAPPGVHPRLEASGGEVNLTKSAPERLGGVIAQLKAGRCAPGSDFPGIFPGEIKQEIVGKPTKMVCFVAFGGFGGPGGGFGGPGGGFVIVVKVMPKPLLRLL